MLGFLGTVIGITLALGDLSPQSLVNEPEVAMQGLLGGLSIALTSDHLALAVRAGENQRHLAIGFCSSLLGIGAALRPSLSGDAVAQEHAHLEWLSTIAKPSATGPS